jgi:hypothetical protein
MSNSSKLKYKIDNDTYLGGFSPKLLDSTSPTGEISLPVVQRLHLWFLVYILIVVLPGPSTIDVGVACLCGYPKCSFGSSCCHGHLGGTSQYTDG